MVDNMKHEISQLQDQTQVDLTPNMPSTQAFKSNAPMSRREFLRDVSILIGGGLASACVSDVKSATSVATKIAALATNPPMREATFVPVATQAKVESDPTQTLAPEVREAVTLVDVKDVEPSLELKSAGVGTDGKYLPSNYPENTDKLKSDINARFNAIKQKFGADVGVYFNQDTTVSDQWILYAEKTDTTEIKYSFIKFPDILRFPGKPLLHNHLIILFSMDQMQTAFCR